MRACAGKYTGFIKNSPHPFLLHRYSGLPVRGAVFELWVVGLGDVSIFLIDDLIFRLRLDMGGALNLVPERVDICVVEEIIAVGELADVSDFPLCTSGLHPLQRIVTVQDQHPTEDLVRLILQLHNTDTLAGYNTNTSSTDTFLVSTWGTRIFHSPSRGATSKLLVDQFLDGP